MTKIIYINDNKISQTCCTCLFILFVILAIILFITMITVLIMICFTSLINFSHTEPTECTDTICILQIIDNQCTISFTNSSLPPCKYENCDIKKIYCNYSEDDLCPITKCEKNRNGGLDLAIFFTPFIMFMIITALAICIHDKIKKLREKEYENMENFNYIEVTDLE